MRKSSAEVVEIDEFYRPYMDQYNARSRALEHLIEIYVEYYKDGISGEVRHPSSTTD